MGINLLSVRQQKLLSYVFRMRKLKVHDLAIQFNISDKTVRNELKEINTIAKNKVVRSNNQGIEIDLSHEALIRELLNTTNEEADSQLENRLIKRLLFEQELLDFDDLLDELFISSSTLANLIRSINEMIDRFDLKIQRKNNKLSLIGKEYNKRRLIISMVLHDNTSAFYNLELVDSMFKNVNTKEVSDQIQVIIHRYGFHIPEFYFTSFMLNMLTIITLPKEDEKELPSHSATQDSIEFQIADAIMQELKLEATEAIKYEIADSLVGIINHNRGENLLPSSIDPQFSENIILLLKQTLEYFKISINFENSIPIFVNHVFLMIQRAKNNYSSYLMENQIVLKDTCLYIYDIALYFCKLVSQHYQIDICESEVSLIAVHIGYYIEEAYSDQHTINVALISEKYELVDNYITDKIHSEFYGKVKIFKNEINSRCDLVITTRKLGHVSEADECLISPLLTNLDKVKIQAAILETINKKNKENFKKLAKQYFDKDLFFYNETLTDKESVLEFLDMKLQRQGIIDEQFFEQIKKREELSPTCFMKLFALPHPFSCTALKSRIAVFINPKQILWDKDHAVQFVFLIAISEEDQPMLKYVFDYFASILSDEMKMLKLKKVKDYEQFFALITS